MEKEISEELIIKKIKSNRTKIITDIFLIVILIIIFAYVYYNVEFIKELKGGVCEMCEKKTGRICDTRNYIPKDNGELSNFKVNLTNLE